MLSTLFLSFSIVIIIIFLVCSFLCFARKLLPFTSSIPNWFHIRFTIHTRISLIKRLLMLLSWKAWIYSIISLQSIMMPTIITWILIFLILTHLTSSKQPTQSSPMIIVHITPIWMSIKLCLQILISCRMILINLISKRICIILRPKVLTTLIMLWMSPLIIISIKAFSMWRPIHINLLQWLIIPLNKF